MTFSRNKLYFILFIACMAGYIWLFIGISELQIKNTSVEVCLIKHITDIPCPSCGSTRSIISLLNGNLLKSILINPLGLVIAIIMFLAPIWIIIDILTKRCTLLIFYFKIEQYLRKKQYAIPLILLVIINWIWNITKGL